MTAFHLVEHLPLDVLIRLMDEIVRVLKPRGLAIFETPNPDNVLVGARNFYLDPTHRNPIPRHLLQVIAEARGLCAPEVLNLHPCPDAVRLLEDGSVTTSCFNEYFYGPMDYALIAGRSNRALAGSAKRPGAIAGTLN